MLRKSIFTSILLGLVWCGSAAHAAGVDGSWEGKLQAGAQTLRIAFHFTTEADGTLRATMDSPDQGAYGIKTDSASFANGEVRCEIKRISGVFEGKFDEAKRTIEGFWTQFGTPMVLSLEPKVQKALNRPQEPKPPYPYVAEDVTIENKKAGVKLAGTLTRPSKGKKFPVAVLITGSGAQNRDEELMGHKPFLVLADSLTRRGIAVLRMDDRGVGGSTKGSDSATSEDFAQDILSALDFLKSRRDIDKKRIGLIGHSEGGLIGPLAAIQSKDVAYLVMLAGPGVKGREIFEKQTDLILEAQKTAPMARAMQTRMQSRMLEMVVTTQDDAGALAEFDKWWAEQSKGTFAGAPEDMLKTLSDNYRAQLKNYSSPWMRYFLKYDPAPTLAKLRMPVLAINGGLDLQVPAKQNLPVIEAALKAGGNKDFTVQELAGLNHLFQLAKTGAPSEYIEIDETINPKALEAVGNWVVAHSGIKSTK